MRAAILPTPSREERAAIEQALAALERRADDRRGEWWRQGLREQVLEGEPEPPRR